ncbi:DUF2914 domain-containing protein [Pyxidicoccus parkwayensis]|uniref:DUF2914 domain-containing protein n=1 Tax=Pyxidicoccus parkwayensis TaxID=2813578 RepID=A0ABX7NP30_9BACT|nr:DUF2914 domain-containing protein [Pyxidicoccus parkwaysis]QSQ19267.1 DUF2914 domain-containing protein [Pyxidicoccus parkwaysis]
MATATQPNSPEKKDDTVEAPGTPAASGNVVIPDTNAAVALPTHSPAAAVDPDDLVDTQKTPTLMEKVQEFRARHEMWEMALFFFGGFIYDVVSLSRIDDTLTLVQSFAYLLILTGLLLLEQRFPEGTEPPRLLSKVWRWREEAVHFLFGSLLSVFMLLLFKATSGFTPYLFVVGLFALLVANELPRFRQVGPVIRVVLLSLCVTLYFACLLPVVIGRMGFWVFLLAVTLGSANVFGLMRLIQRWRPDVEFLIRNVAIPGFGVQAALLVLYLLGVIPPLPVAVQFADIYHKVERVSPGVYQLSSVDDSVWFKPWTWFGPDFAMQPGDKPYYFFRIFAPKGFAPYKVRVRWYYDHPDKGWTTYGNGFMANVSSNGTDGGYRYYATTSNLKPGAWRVVLETEDGHEIHRINFSVAPDARTEPRQYKLEYSTLKELKPLSQEDYEKTRKSAAVKPGEPSKPTGGTTPAPAPTPGSVGTEPGETAPTAEGTAQ